MNVERILAHRMAQSNRELGSRPVVRIATAGVTLGVALMILAAAIVQGFQREVKMLVVGFDSHLKVAHSDPTVDGLVWTPTQRDTLAAMPGVKHVALRHERAGILETPDALQGVVIRGVDETSQLDRIETGLLKGRLPAPTAETDMAIGQPLAAKFSVDTGDKVTLYLVVGDGDIRPRPFTVVGIYQTGLQEFDKRHVWVPAGVMQRATGRGAEGQVVIEATPNGPRAVGQSFGRDPLGATWTGRWDGLPSRLGVSGRRSLDLSSVDPSSTPLWIVGEGPLTDTVSLFWDDSTASWTAPVSGGTHHRVVDGYDLWLDDLDVLAEVQTEAFRRIPYDWQAIRVDQQNPEMFSWLAMLDMNVQVIVGLMVLISIVNMTSALLIIILERRSQVGLLKALGMTDGSVVQTFLWHAARILATGFAWGNATGFGVALIQSMWKPIPLNPEAYYVDHVPIWVDIPYILTMEGLAFILCVVAMWLPALWSTRIRPALGLRLA